MSKLISAQRALSLYREALQRGDLDSVAAILWLAERDPLLLDLINKFHQSHDISESVVSDAPQPTDKVTGGLTILKPSPNGLPLQTVHQEEDKIMNIAIPNRQIKPYPRVLSAVAAALLLLIFGMVLVTMLAIPIGNNFGQIVQLTQAPLKAGCQLNTTATASEESLRLAQASNEVLDAEEPDNELAMLLAICALQTAYSRETDAALQQALVAADLVPEFPTFRGSNGSLQSFQLSPDGRYLLTGNSDGAHLWDIATGEDVRVFPYSPTFYNGSVAFSPDGKYVLTQIRVGTARLWEVESGATVHDFNAGTDIFSFAFSPDGTRIAIGVLDGHVQLWDATTGTLVNSIAAHTQGVGYVDFSPDSRRLLISGSGTGSYILQLWDVETGEKIREFTGLREPQAGIFSPDGRYVIAGGRPTDPRAVLWDAETGAEIREFTDFPYYHTGYNHVQAFAFSPDGRYVLIGSANKLAKIYEVETGVEVRYFDDIPPTYIHTVAFSPDGRWIVIGSNVARVWSTDYRDLIADACRGISRDFTVEERTQHGLRDGVPTCPQFAEGYALEPGMTPIPTQPIPIWTPLPTLESTGG